MIEKKICNFITLYKLPSQNQDDFQAFNAKAKNWCSTNFEGITVENVTSQLV